MVYYNEMFMRLSIVLGLLLTAAFCVAAAAPEKTDSDVWNEAVEAYRSGEKAQSLERARTLLLSRTHGSRAAELTARLAMERVQDRSETNSLAFHEEAARAAQIALRANPTDKRANENFSRTLAGLAEQRDAHHIQDVLMKAGQKDPGSELDQMVRGFRQLMGELTVVPTSGVECVARADAQEAKLKSIADQWLGLGTALAQAVTNQEEMATLTDRLQQSRQRTLMAAEKASNLDQGAYSDLAQVETDAFGLMKRVLNPPAALQWGYETQSNAWQDVARVNDHDWQADALDFTHLFRTGFPAWAKAYEQQAASQTNMPPFTAEAQEKVKILAEELEKVQSDLIGKALPPEQEKALALIEEIQKLLPQSPSNGGQSSNPNAGQGQNQNQQNDKNKSDSDAKDQKDNESQENNDTEANQEDSDEKNTPKADEKPSEDESTLEQMLKSAQERSDEHEEDKKRRMRKIKMLPNERDW